MPATSRQITGPTNKARRISLPVGVRWPVSLRRSSSLQHEDPDLPVGAEQAFDVLGVAGGDDGRVKIEGG